MREESEHEKTPQLLPCPRQLTRAAGYFELGAGGRIVLEGAEPERLRFAAGQLREALSVGARAEWALGEGLSALRPGERVISLCRAPGNGTRPDGYRLTVGTDQVRVDAAEPGGIFYGVQTLIQWAGLFPVRLPCVSVDDWPGFSHRGVLIDISRNRVPSMETLFGLIDKLAGWKINQLQLYTEHTFAYENHPQVWAEASPLTGEEIRLLDDYCRERFVELVPNQNSFGHMRPWLVHGPYRRLAECPDGCDTIWGRFEEPFTLYPSVESFEFIRSLYDELLPNFSSRQLNAGCDEPVDLGQGRSKAAVAERGLPAVYLEFVLRLHQDLARRGVTMQMWGDVIASHPALAAELPGDLVVLEWGYEADHPFDARAEALAKAGVPYYVCPGTSSWNSVAGRTDNALANLRSAAESGARQGAAGYLITDWGDNGHWQPLPVSYLGLGYGAAMAWAPEANREIDIAKALDDHVYRDPGGTIGRLAYVLGNVHQLTGIDVANGTALFHVLQSKRRDLASWLQAQESSERAGGADVGLARWQATRGRIDEISDGIGRAQMSCGDADLVRKELAWAAGMLGHACDRAIWARGEGDGALGRRLIADADRRIEEFRELWRARSRPGGFKESVSRLKAMREDYE